MESSRSSSQSKAPNFIGESYSLWVLKMKTLLSSKDLWKFIENGYNQDDNQDQLEENQKKDAKALFLIQQALEEKFLIRISEADTTKQG